LNASDIAVLCDPDGTMTYVSSSVAKVMGLDGERMLGHTPWGYVHADDLALVHAAWDASVAGSADPSPIEFRARHGSGEWRWLEMHVGNLIDDPAVRGMVVNLRDVTERRVSQ